MLGRGEMHLSILIETMRREGFELQVSAPKVLFKEIDGQRCEPMERLVADARGGCRQRHREVERQKGRASAYASVGIAYAPRVPHPSRGLFGYTNDFLTDTKGEGIISTIFEGYAPLRARFPNGRWALSSPLRAAKL